MLTFFLLFFLLSSIFADAGTYSSAPVFKSAASAAAAELLLKKQKEGASYFGDSADKPMTLDDVCLAFCFFLCFLARCTCVYKVRIVFLMWCFVST